MATEAHEKLRELMRRLTAATYSRKIYWAEDAHTFTYTTSASSVVLGSRDDDGVEPFFVEVFNSQGQMVEKFTTTPGMRSSRELSDLYEAARRQALKVDEVIDDLMGDLPPDPDEPPF